MISILHGVGYGIYLRYRKILKHNVPLVQKIHSWNLIAENGLRNNNIWQGFMDRRQGIKERK